MGFKFGLIGLFCFAFNKMFRVSFRVSTVVPFFGFSQLYI